MSGDKKRKSGFLRWFASGLAALTGRHRTDGHGLEEPSTASLPAKAVRNFIAGEGAPRVADKLNADAADGMGNEIPVGGGRPIGSGGDGRAREVSLAGAESSSDQCDVTPGDISGEAEISGNRYGEERSQSAAFEAALLQYIGSIDSDAPWDALAGEDANKQEGALRLLECPWGEPAARRAVVGRLRFKFPSRRAALLQINPQPLSSEARTVGWACRVAQSVLDAWRAEDPDADRALGALFRWADGHTASLEGAIADEFSAPDLFAALMHDLDDRDWEVMRRRSAGETLDDVGRQFGVTRERVRQIGQRIDRNVATRFYATLKSGHPAAAALAVHIERLAFKITDAATQEDGILRERERQKWARKILSPDELIVLNAIESCLDHIPEDNRSRIEGLFHAGNMLADGWTTLPWTDADIHRLRSSFERLAGVHGFTTVDALSVEAGMPSADVRRLAKVCDLRVAGDIVAERGVRKAQLRALRIAEILRSSSRPMHFAEIVLAGLNPPSLEEWTTLKVLRSMEGDNGVFRSNGDGIWGLVECYPEGIEDNRAAVPVDVSFLPLDSIKAYLRCTDHDASSGALLVGLDPLDPSFVARAADRIAEALLGHDPWGRSVGEVVRHRDDHSILRDWLLLPHGTDGGIQPITDQIEENAAFGLVLTAAAVAASRVQTPIGRAGWRIVHAACGSDMRRRLFAGVHGILQRQPKSSIIRAVHHYRLRHAFDCRVEPWSSYLLLHCGLPKIRLRRLPQLLEGSAIPSEAVSFLTAQGRNYSESFSLFWSALRAFYQGDIIDADIHILAKRSPWWPGWHPDEVVSALRETPEYDVEAEDPEGCEIEEDDQQEDDENVLPRDLGLSASSVSLDVNAMAFVLSLPEQLHATPGPVAISGEGFRLAGVVDEDGAVDWHGDGRVRLPLRGSPRRAIRIERDGVLLAETQVTLWSPEDFLVLYDFGSGRQIALDPYAATLSRSGPHALILHPSLTPSAEADEERELDQGYALHVYQQSFPVGLTVTCEDEVLWQPQIQTERRIFLDISPVVLSGDAADIRWGDTCDLRMRDLPEGFIPSRAVIGEQRLEVAEASPGRWRALGYRVMPGNDPLRRRGRIEGRYRDQRAVVPASVVLKRPAQGALLIAPGGNMRPLLSSDTVNLGQDLNSRLWVFRSQEEETPERIILEGARPAGRHGLHGLRLGAALYGLGEPLSIAPAAFNRNGTTTPIAGAVVDLGIVDHAVREGSTVRLHLKSSIEWSDNHTALAWGSGGFRNCPVMNTADDGSHIIFGLGEHDSADIAGISLLYNGAWLGSAHISDDPDGSIARLLSAKGSICVLGTALQARLPLLGTRALGGATLHAIRHGTDALEAVLSATATSAMEHAGCQILARWAPRDGGANSLVSAFLAFVDLHEAGLSQLEGLMQVNPITALRVLRSALPALSPNQARHALGALLVRSLPLDLPEEVRAAISPRHPERSAGDLQEAMLDIACRATQLDRVFLASRSDVSIASQAWASALPQVPPAYPDNLATAMTIAPIRRWLATHFIARLLLQGP